MQLDRLDEKKRKLDLAKEKKQADLMLLDGEDSDEDFFQYKITGKDWEILQKAKAQEGQNINAFPQQQ